MAAAEITSTIQSASLNRLPSSTSVLRPSSSSSPPTTTTHPLSPSPPHRQRPLPPLPDLRFQQSYLSSLQGAQNRWEVAYITVRDQVVLPLLQGALWTLVLAGWRHWHAGKEQFTGRSVGARVRRWWWGVNGWAYPEA